METFAKLFERFLVFVYHCFDRIVIQGYMPLLTRPENIVHFFRDVHGRYPITPQVLAKRTPEYRGWVDAYARNHKIPMLKAEIRANQMRLYLSAAAYTLVGGLRRVGLKGTELAQAQVSTIRTKVLKIGAQIRISVRKIWISMASSYPWQGLYRQVWSNLSC